MLLPYKVRRFLMKGDKNDFYQDKFELGDR